MCSAITERNDLGDQGPCLPDGVTGPGRYEQNGGAMRGDKGDEEGVEPGGQLVGIVDDNGLTNL